MAREVMGYVYLIRNGDLYKIGHTENLERRLKQLQPCVLIQSLVADRSLNLEQELHKRFQSVRLPQTEYFRLNDYQVEQVRLLLGWKKPQNLPAQELTGWKNRLSRCLSRSPSRLIPSVGTLPSLRKTPIKATTGGLSKERSRVKFVPRSVKQGCSVSVKRGVRIRSFATASTGKRCGGPRRKILGSSKAAFSNSVRVPRARGEDWRFVLTVADSQTRGHARTSRYVWTNPLRRSASADDGQKNTPSPKQVVFGDEAVSDVCVSVAPR